MIGLMLDLHLDLVLAPQVFQTLILGSGHELRPSANNAVDQGGGCDGGLDSKRKDKGNRCDCKWKLLQTVLIKLCLSQILWPKQWCSGQFFSC